MRTGPSAQAEAVHDDPRESILDERPADGLEEGGFLHRSLRSFVSAGHGRRGGEGNTIRTRKPQAGCVGRRPALGPRRLIAPRLRNAWPSCSMMRPTRASEPDGYLLGSYRIATAPEPNSSRLTSFKSTCFDSPANNV